jgi:Family of unknown function (DUF5723)
MKTKFLQYGIWSLILSVASQFATSQTVARTSYFMDNATHRHLMNPALVPARGYVSLPVAGEFSMGFESNMQFSNLIYPSSTEGGKPQLFLNESVDANEFLSKLDPVNYFRMNMRTSLVSFGFYTKTAFWTFDIATRANMNMNLPYDFFKFLKIGMSNSAGNRYEIRDLSVGASLFTEVSLGYSRNIMNNLRVGAKLKYLAGVANIKVNVDKMDINMKPDQWTISTQGQMDVYGKGLSFEKDTSDAVNGVKVSNPGLGGMGMAVDLGATYSPIPNLDLSLGIVDLGSIKWKKANVLQAKSSGSVSFSGIDQIGVDDAHNNANDAQIEKLKDDLMTMADFKEKAVTKDAIQKLYPTINAGAEYAFLENKLSLGLLFTNRLMEDENYSELMSAVNYRPNSWVNLSGSYSFMHGKFETFGWALGFSPKIINFFLACDYTIWNVSPQFIPLNTFTTNFQLGISVPLGQGHLPAKF